MSSLLLRIQEGLRSLRPKPAVTSASAAEKKRYSERMSEQLAYAFAAEFRVRGLKGTRPAPDGQLGSLSGAERRIAGGIGAKKVDVSWATEESGLIFGMSIKTINFPNYQKNLVNRRGDMLFEAVTVHRRFPYAVLVGLLCFDVGASSDHTERRKSTVFNAHARLRLFSNRDDPAGREEQFEKFYVALVDAEAEPPAFSLFRVGEPDREMECSQLVSEILEVTAERNPDFYQVSDLNLVKAR